MSFGAGPHEVLVTGVGLHTAHGDGPSTWKAIGERRQVVTAYRSPEAEGFPAVAAAPAPPCALDDLVPDRKLQKYMSPAAALAVLAAGRALRDGGLLGDAGRCGRLALFAATGLIGFDLAEVTYAMSSAGPPGDVLDGERMARGLSLCHPLMPFRMLLNMPLGLVSIAYGIRGENAIFYPGPLQGGMALRIAFHAVASGRCARALAGGSVHGLALMPLSAAWRAGRLECRPGDAAHGDACGVAATDAGAFVLLESRAAARERGARPRAALLAVQAGMADDAAGRERAWRDLGARSPGLVLSSGSLGEASDAEDLRLASEAGAPRGAVVNVDALAGHAGPAAPAAAVALAALALSDAAPTGPTSSLPGAAMVAARDPEGGLVLASLARTSAEGLA